jgi:hypothetical protein
MALAEQPDPAALPWLERMLKESGAVSMSVQSGHAGSVDAVWRTWHWPDGEKIEAWSDNYTALNIRGNEARVSDLVRQYRELQADG